MKNLFTIYVKYPVCGGDCYPSDEEMAELMFIRENKLMVEFDCDDCGASLEAEISSVSLSNVECK